MHPNVAGKLPTLQQKRLSNMASMAPHLVDQLNGLCPFMYVLRRHESMVLTASC
jgi:hypothetical protein